MKNTSELIRTLFTPRRTLIYKGLDGFHSALFASARYKNAMRTADFDFLLPPELVAQTPAPERDLSRLMVLRRPEGSLEHRKFGDALDYFRAGDVLVLNDSRVIRARLRGKNAITGGEFEIQLLEETGVNDWWVMLRPGKRACVQTEICFQDRHGKISGISARVVETNNEGHRRLHFAGTKKIGRASCRERV